MCSSGFLCQSVAPKWHQLAEEGACDRTHIRCLTHRTRCGVGGGALGNSAAQGAAPARAVRLGAPCRRVRDRCVQLLCAVKKGFCKTVIFCILYYFRLCIGSPGRGCIFHLTTTSTIISRASRGTWGGSVVAPPRGGPGAVRDAHVCCEFYSPRLFGNSNEKRQSSKTPQGSSSKVKNC